MPRAPRLLPWIALAASAVALVWALIGLHAVFREERDEAYQASEAQRRALEEYAAQTLSEALAERMRGSSEALSAAEIDPLRDDRDLYLQRRGLQVLPRTWYATKGSEWPARELHAQLLRDPSNV